MTTYAKVVNGAATHPYRISDLRNENPNISFPENALTDANTRNEFGIEEVSKGALPSPKKGWKLIRSELKLVDGSWTDSWELQPKLESEVEDNDYTNPDVEDSISSDQFEDAGGAAVSLDGLPVVVKESFNNGPVWVSDHWEKDWQLRDLSYVEKRKNAYGDPWDQLEYIAENSIDSWLSKIAEIKSRYPKA